MAHKKRSHRIGKSKKKKRSSKKMPDHVLAHFMAKTISLAKRRGITPKLLTKKRRRR